MSQSSSTIRFSSVDAGYDWEWWATKGHRGCRLKMLLKFAFWSILKPIPKADLTSSSYTSPHRHNGDLCSNSMNLSSFASSLLKVPCGRHQSNWSFTSANSCPAWWGLDAITLSQGASVLRQSRQVGLLAAENWQSRLSTPNIKCHFNSQPLGKPRPLEEWTHAKQLL